LDFDIGIITESGAAAASVGLQIYRHVNYNEFITDLQSKRIATKVINT